MKLTDIYFEIIMGVMAGCVLIYWSNKYLKPNFPDLSSMVNSILTTVLFLLGTLGVIACIRFLRRPKNETD